MLANYGQVNRKVISDYFGLSTPQVSADLAEYMLKAPGNVEYDRMLKTYRVTNSFYRAFL